MVMVKEHTFTLMDKVCRGMEEWEKTWSRDRNLV